MGVRSAPARFCLPCSLSGEALLSPYVNISGQYTASGQHFICPILIVSNALTRSGLFSFAFKLDIFVYCADGPPPPICAMWRWGGESLSGGLGREVAFWGFTLPLTEAGSLPASAACPPSLVQASWVRELFFPFEVFTSCSATTRRC